MNEQDVIYRKLTMFDTAFRCMTFPSLQHLVGVSEFKGNNVISIGAFIDEIPAGLILCTLQESEAQIQSVFVSSELRGCGLSKGLVSELIGFLKDIKGLKRLFCIFQQNRPYSKVVGHILDLAGFSAPDTRCLIFRCGPALREMPWLKRYNYTPHGFRIIPWEELSDTQLESIRVHVSKDSDFPAELEPFREIHLMEPRTTLALLDSREQVVGWSMTHRIKSDTIRYSGIYVKEGIQGAGLAMILLMNSIARQVLTELLDTVPYGIFAVYKRTPMMLKMCRKRFTPYTDSVSESVERTLPLG